MVNRTNVVYVAARSKQTSSEMLEELRRKRKSAQDRAKLTDTAVEEESEEMKVHTYLRLICDFMVLNPIKTWFETCLVCFR